MKKMVQKRCLIKLPEKQPIIKNVIYGGKRCDFNFEQKDFSELQERKLGGREFQTEGVEYEKERLPRIERISGIVSNLGEEEDLSVLGG